MIAAAGPAGPMSLSWDVPLAGGVAGETIVCRRVQWRTDDERSSGGDALADLVLGPGERSAWRRMDALPKRRSEWLHGRIAAKEAVRELLRDRAGLFLPPDAIEIIADERGRPLVQGTWTAQLGAAPLVTISHTAGVAVAMAALDPALSIGIDIELCRERRRRFEMAAFTADERQLVADLDDRARDEWYLRLWCAKEAAGKALGCGLIDGPHGIEATAARIETGLVELAQSASRRVAGASGRTMVARTARAADCVCAVVLFRRDRGQNVNPVPGSLAKDLSATS